jgi:hypothetical protein
MLMCAQLVYEGGIKTFPEFYSTEITTSCYSKGDGVCRSGLWSMLQQAEVQWCAAVSHGETTGSCAMTIHPITPPLQSSTFLCCKKPNPNHYLAIKLSIFYSMQLLALPKIWDGSQRSTFCANGGNSIKFDYVTTGLTAIPENDFQRCFQQW